MKKVLNVGKLEIFANEELKTLRGKCFGLNLYRAGKNKNKKGGFNFYARDLILSAILLDDLKLLRDSLDLCLILQGKNNNSYNGEEKGKIFHEYPEKKISEKFGVNSGYNASDTTSIFLIGLEYHFNKSRDFSFLKKFEKSIFLSLEYIRRHIKDDVFWESPKFSGAEKFRLKSTYWKDTGFLGRYGNTPIYPVAYTIVQAQVLKSLGSAYALLNLLGRKDKSLLKLKKRMSRKIWTFFWDKEMQNLSVGVDKKGLIRSNSSDYFHLLFYLDKREVSRRKLKKIIKSNLNLRTVYGYRGAIEGNEVDEYYGAVWPWEQAFIYLAGEKHGIRELQKISMNSLRAVIELKCFPEVIRYFKGKIDSMKYNTQLWTIASTLFLIKKLRGRKI